MQRFQDGIKHTTLLSVYKWQVLDRVGLDSDHGSQFRRPRGTMGNCKTKCRGFCSACCLRCNFCVREYVCCCICDDSATMMQKRLIKAHETLKRGIALMDAARPKHLSRIADLTQLIQLTKYRLRTLVENYEDATRRRNETLRKMEEARAKRQPFNQTVYEALLTNPPDGSLIASNSTLLATYASELASVHRSKRDIDDKLSVMREDENELQQMIANSEFRADMAAAASLLETLYPANADSVDQENMKKKFKNETKAFDYIKKLNRAFEGSLKERGDQRGDKGSELYDPQTILDGLLSDLRLPKEYELLARSSLSHTSAVDAGSKASKDEKKPRDKHPAPKREEMETALLPTLSEREETISQFSIADAAEVDVQGDDQIELSVTQVRISEEKEDVDAEQQAVAVM